NPNLKPEVGYEWSAGVHHKWNKRLSGNASVFTRKTSNKITSDYVLATGKYTYYNASKENAHGFTADITNRISNDWSTRLAYTYLYTHTPGKINNARGYLPKHEVVLGVDYAHNKWDAHFDMRVVANRRGAMENFFPRNSYAIANLAANYQATKDIKVFGAVNNLFDTYYAENSNVYGTNFNDWWSMPGRNYRFGVELSF
ncbi:MAG: TonB-dependent receptor, partial [Veillonella sp.]|nr:TonB-dependent receptor [Veillonella sp.]